MAHQQSIYNPYHLPKPSSHSIRGFVPNTLSPAYSVRHAHIIRLYDMLLLLISQAPSRTNSTQCLRAWIALCHCSEIDLIPLYKIGGIVLERAAALQYETEYDEAIKEKKADWFKFNLSAGNKDQDKVDRLNEYCLSLVAAGRAKDALDELQTYLPAHPYHESIKLNSLAGSLSLHLAQTTITAVPKRAFDLNATILGDDTSDSDEDEQATIDNANQPGENDRLQERTRLRKEKHEEALQNFLFELSSSSSALYNEAKEYFRQAARMEKKDPEYSLGEATRWLQVMDAVEVGKHKRSRSSSGSVPSSP